MQAEVRHCFAVSVHGVPPVVLDPNEPLLVVIVEPGGKLAGLEGADHLAEHVVGVPLLSAPDDEAPVIISDKLEVSKLDHPVTAVIAHGDPLTLLCHGDNITIDVMAVNPVGVFRFGQRCTRTHQAE